MIEIILVALIVLVMVITAILIGLLSAHRRLKQTCRVLEDCVERHSKDIAGLCSAAVAVDSRVVGNDELLKDIAEKLAKYDEEDFQAVNPAQPYHRAIQKIHNGASADELVRECGVSRDEAMLLIRLHAHEKNTKGVSGAPFDF